MTNVQKFYEALANDETLQDKAQKLNEKYGEEKLPESEILAESVRFAESEGYSFTIAELEEYMKAKKSEMGGEIDENELEAVAGGFVHQPKDISGGCACYWAGGGGGRHNNGEIAWGCGCAGYGQGGDAIAWHWICICMAGGVGGFRGQAL